MKRKKEYSNTRTTSQDGFDVCWHLTCCSFVSRVGYHVSFVIYLKFDFHHPWALNQGPPQRLDCRMEGEASGHAGKTVMSTAWKHFYLENWTNYTVKLILSMTQWILVFPTCRRQGSGLKCQTKLYNCCTLWLSYCTKMYYLSWVQDIDKQK